MTLEGSVEAAAEEDKQLFSIPFAEENDFGFCLSEISILSMYLAWLSEIASEIEKERRQSLI